mgnify:CR=1 FL=1
MGTYREWIEKLKSEWIGKTVIYENEKYNVVNVDYNGMLLIDKKAKHTDTTAISITTARKEN